MKSDNSNLIHLVSNCSNHYKKLHFLGWTVYGPLLFRSLNLLLSIIHVKMTALSLYMSHSAELVQSQSWKHLDFPFFFSAHIL